MTEPGRSTADSSGAPPEPRQLLVCICLSQMVQSATESNIYDKLRRQFVSTPPRVRHSGCDCVLERSLACRNATRVTCRCGSGRERGTVESGTVSSSCTPSTILGLLRRRDLRPLIPSKSTVRPLELVEATTPPVTTPTHGSDRCIDLGGHSPARVPGRGGRLTRYR
jgi:hypothetical protein